MKPDWAERKVTGEGATMWKSMRYFRTTAVAELLRSERRRVVRKCRELECKSINGYALGCSDCATAIAGGK